MTALRLKDQTLPAVRRARVGAILSALVLLQLLVTPGTHAVARTVRPELRLISSSDHIEVQRFGSGALYLDLGAYVSAAGVPLEVHVWRPDYQHALKADLIVHGPDGPLAVRLPRDVIARGGLGLRAFFRLKIVTKRGAVKTDRVLSFCPNTYQPQRIDGSGPLLPTYPWSCIANPFMKGMVWGIDRGWASNALTYGARVFLDPGRYIAYLSIRDRYRRMFDILAADAKVRVVMDVVKRSGCQFCGGAAPRSDAAPTSTRTSLTPAPALHLVDRSTMPDLVALPAFGMNTVHRQKRDWLSFGANVWDRGPAPLVVEGYRDPDEALMRAYQYFFRDEKVVGRSRVGTFEFDDRDGHNHWHFRQFATYHLLDDSKRFVVGSKKEAFCLAPTDPLDLLAPGAVLRPETVGLTTACGGPTALWIRETLPVGWGDTYYQYLPGQSFDITDLPNGTSFVEVRANPTRRLYDRNLGNNVRLRKVILKGEPGHRKVVVPAWHHIDTDPR